MANILFKDEAPAKGRILFQDQPEQQMNLSLTGGQRSQKQEWPSYLAEGAENALLGGGDAIRKLLTAGYAKPYNEQQQGIAQLLAGQQLPQMPPERLGNAYQAGHIAGDIGSFLAGGSALKGAGAAMEHGPQLLQALKSGMSRIPYNQALGRVGGSALYEGLESPDDRIKGAERGAVAGALGETLTAPFRLGGWIAEKMNPLKSAAKRQQFLAGEADKAYKSMEDAYAPIHQAYDSHVIRNPKDFLGYHKAEMNYFTPEVRRVYEDFTTVPTFKNLHKLSVQMGKDAAKLSNSPEKINTYQTLSRLRNEIEETHLPSIFGNDKAALEQYSKAKAIGREHYYPFLTGKALSKVSKGVTTGLSPAQLNNAISKAVESMQMSGKNLHPGHPLLKVLNKNTKAMERAQAYKDITAPALTALGAAGGIVGAGLGGTAGHFIAPHILNLMQNPAMNRLGGHLRSGSRALLEELANYHNTTKPMELEVIGHRK